MTFDHDSRLKAVTVNLSRGGICIASDYVAAPGTELGGAVILPDGREANFEAVVAWARKVRSLQDSNKMGLDFVIPPGEDYYEMIETAFDSRAATHSVSLAVQARRVAHSEHPAHAPATTPVSERRVALADEASGELELEPANVSAARMTAATQSAEIAAVEPPRHDARAPAPVSWAASPVGLTERINVMAKPEDLAGLRSGGAGPSFASVADWVERASVRTILDLLPRGVTTLGGALTLRVTHEPPLEAKARITATAKVTAISDDGRTLTFDVQVEEGGRTLAQARLSRVVVGK